MSGIITNLSQPVDSVRKGANFFTVPAGKYAIATFTAYPKGTIANAQKLSGTSNASPSIQGEIFERQYPSVTIFADENETVDWEITENAYDITVNYDVQPASINADEEDRTILTVFVNGVSSAHMHLGGVKATFVTNGAFNGTYRFQLQMDYKITKNVAYFDK